MTRLSGRSGAERRRSRRVEWFVARRYLSGGKGRGFLSLITLIAIGGVTVGVMALIVVTAVMSGLQKDLREKILGASPHGMVIRLGEDLRMEDWPSVVELVRRDSAVIAAAPFIYTEVVLAPPGGFNEGAVLKAIPGDAEALAVTRVDEYVTEGKMPFGPTESGRPGLLIGRGLADRHALYPGQIVTVVSVQNAELTPTGLQPQMRRFEVTGVFETGLYQYDTKWTYTDLATAQSFLNIGDGVTGVEFSIADPWKAAEVARRLDYEFSYPYRVDDWQHQNASLFGALKLEKLAMTVILLLIVLVASFNIISTLIMVVTDKTREIGILRSMGVTSNGIMRIFLFQGVVIGFVGTVVGGTLGAVLAYLLDRYEFITLPGDVYFIDRLPVDVNAVDVGLIVIASVAISFLATIYPARRAAELTPVEAIRHE
ncbi:MAG: ABC transporter permease [Gemmatimonadetes bacterium]|nr:ABC transporter permease [Gemmatimonadota bacterium]